MIEYEDSDIYQFADDLAVFADIGTDAPSVIETAQGRVIRLVRLGENTELHFSMSDRSIIEVLGDKRTKHHDFRALLASDNFANLRSWAHKQKTFFDLTGLVSEQDLELYGSLDNAFEEIDIAAFDKRLLKPQPSETTRVALIDGPAGIGKTHFISHLTHRRAVGYNKNRAPLILHVQSRGKTLSFIQDLMAYSLQRLRIDVTFDQVPTLSKYGLVTIAIDGFDELADPDGYSLAWGQVGNLINSIRGAGSILLAGRETFIGQNRIIKDIRAIRSEVDDVLVLTLRPPTKSEAMQWLSSKGWPDERMAAIDPLLENGSFALRPFFLNTLIENKIFAELEDATAGNLLTILVESLANREIEKFGEQVELSLNKDGRKKFLFDFLCEVARDMAENNSASVSDATISWLIEYSLPEGIQESTQRLLQGRGQVIAFLTNDDRPGFRRFYHEKFYEYFLSFALYQNISNQHANKFLSRGVIGSSLLETFNVVLSNQKEDDIKQFFLGGLSTASKAFTTDRTKKNVCSLIISGANFADVITPVAFENVEIDEARIVGTSASISMKNVIISQLDCRSADASKIEMNKCSVFTIIVDDETLISANFPVPLRIQDTGSRRRTISDPLEIIDWLRGHNDEPQPDTNLLVPEPLRDHEAFRLISRACRSKNYWLRFSDDIHTNRILDNEYWPLVEKKLSDAGLLTVEYRGASGTNNRFIHVRKANDILSQNGNVPEVISFYKEMVEAFLPSISYDSNIQTDRAD